VVNPDLLKRLFGQPVSRVILLAGGPTPFDIVELAAKFARLAVELLDARRMGERLLLHLLDSSFRIPLDKQGIPAHAHFDQGFEPGDQGQVFCPVGCGELPMRVATKTGAYPAVVLQNDPPVAHETGVPASFPRQTLEEAVKLQCIHFAQYKMK
jgi:hypothetical protein